MDNYTKTLDQIRAFNRFYTAHFGFLDRNYLHSGHSITETRMLFELKNHPDGMNAKQFVTNLHVNKGYISRIVRSFETHGLITRTQDENDGRYYILRLTPEGLKETDRLIAITNQDIGDRIQDMDSDTCAKLSEAMQTIIDILQDDPDPSQQPSQRSRYEKNKNIFHY